MWTDEEKEAVSLLWKSGLSASQCAKELHEQGFAPRSRNAVIGVLHRMRAPKRGNQSSKHVARDVIKQRRAKAKAARVPQIRLTPAVLQAFKEAPDLEPLKAEDGSVHTVLTVGKGICRWPCGDPRDAAFGFCGRAADDHIYCTHHQVASFTHVEPKRRTPRGHDYARREDYRNAVRWGAV